MQCRTDLIIFLCKGFIEASEDGYNNTVNLGRSLVDDDHYAKEDIEEKVVIVNA